MKRLSILLMLVLFALASCQKDDEPTIIPDPDPEVIDPVDPDPEEPTQPEDIIYPRKEMRAVWMATVYNVDWPKNTIPMLQQQEYINYLELFKKHNINTVIVQIRPMADAFYNSSLEPWSQYITGTQGQDPGYDVLRFMIDETHKRGMEFHAWFNPYRISGTASTFNPPSTHIAKQHPEWTMRYNNLLLFRPGVPEVQTFFLSVVEDVINKYDVDGVHLDDYFYPYPEAGFTLDDQADYVTYGGEYTSIENFRRASVNKIIEGIHNLIVANRPDVLFTVSPFSENNENYTYLFADVKLWCQNSWIDCVIPQLYASTGANFANFLAQLDWWLNNSYDVPVVIGHALYKFGDASQTPDLLYQSTRELENQLTSVRMRKNAQGNVWYNASSFTNNRLNVMSVIDKFYDTPALVPFMGRETQAAPEAVTNLSVADGKLTWQATGSNLRFAVYRVQNGVASLVTVTTEKSYEPQEDGDYAISAISKDNVESSPSKVVNYK